MFSQSQPNFDFRLFSTYFLPAVTILEKETLRFPAQRENPAAETASAIISVMIKVILALCRRSVNVENCSLNVLFCMGQAVF